MSAQVTMMIPSAEAFDKNVEGGSAREIEFTGTLSVEYSDVHSSRFPANSAVRFTFLDGVVRIWDGPSSCIIRQFSNNLCFLWSHHLYDSLAKSGRDGPQIHEQRRPAAKSFWKRSFIRIGDGSSGLDSC